MPSQPRGHADRSTKLHLGNTDELRISVAVMPMATVLSLLADISGHRSQGVDLRRRAELRRSLSCDPWTVLHPLFTREASALPDCLSPSVEVRDADFETHLELITAAARSGLAYEVERTYGGEPPTAVRPLVDSPDTWLASYTRLMREVWSVYAPAWQRIRRLIDREIERVGTAVVRGAVDALLSCISPRCRYSEGQLMVPDPEPDEFELDGRRLVLTPTAAGAGSQILAPDLPGVVWLGYPLPALNRPQSAEDDRADGLELVLGAVRARLLRELGTEKNMGSLAQTLVMRPASVTYHVDRMEEAGLLHRRRHGRRIDVIRTARGGSLIDLLS